MRHSPEALMDPAAIDNVYLTAQVFVYKTTNFSYCYDPGTLLYELGAELFYSGDSDNSTLDLGLFDTVTGGSDSGSLTLDLERRAGVFCGLHSAGKGKQQCRLMG